MKRKIKVILGGVVLAVAALAGFYCMKKLQSYAGELVLGYGKTGISGEQVEIFWKQKETEDDQLKDITLYCGKGYQTVENREFGRKTSALVTEVYGNMNPVFPDRLRRGSLVSGYDEKGCVLSELLAEELFSSHDVEGKNVLIHGQEYAVRGLVAVDSRVVMIQGKKENCYSHIWVSYEGMSASAAQQELSGILPQEADVKSEGDLYAGLGRLILAVPVLLLFLAGMTALRRWYRNKIQNIWIREACGIFLLFAVILGIYGIVVYGLHFTDDYLPPRWEDFSFWGELWTEKAEDVKRLIASGLEYRDRKMLELLAGAGICSAAESVGILLLFTHR